MCGICFGIRFVPSTTTSSSSLCYDAGSPISCDEEDVKDDLLKGEKWNEDWDKIVAGVKSRGPDHASTSSLLLPLSTSPAVSVELKFHTSVLSLRGREGSITKQPFVEARSNGEAGDVLCWNGEVFGGIEVGPKENDGSKLFSLLNVDSKTSKTFFDILNTLRGPYALIYYQSASRKIWFARDPLGRRSLLIKKVAGGIWLSSCTPGGLTEELGEGWEEVGVENVWCLDLGLLESDKDKSILNAITSFPRNPISAKLDSESLTYPFDRLNSALPLLTDLLPLDADSQPTILTPVLSATITTFLALLSQSILSRISTIPHFLPAPHARIAILFSGGLDCTVLALIVDKLLEVGERIDLINVSFENPRKLRGQTHGKEVGSVKELRRRKKAEGMGTGYKGVKKSEAKVDVVSLEGTKVSESEGKTPEPKSIYDGPDRLTGKATVQELRQLRPDRDWNFIEVDVTYEEMLQGKDRVIQLLRPHNTVMDLSIAIAFYFAAKGTGFIRNPITSPSAAPRVPYQSDARVLLSGLGADELLGGYSRHRRSFFQNSLLPTGDWKSLISELQMDLDRIGTRNLGRDDRIISYHGKEARYPFLDEVFVKLVIALPIWLKCDFRGKEGVGEKLLLRCAAKELGLSEASQLKKRAIHFGAGTAKMELDSGKHRGDHVL